MCSTVNKRNNHHNWSSSFFYLNWRRILKEVLVNGMHVVELNVAVRNEELIIYTGGDLCDSINSSGDVCDKGSTNCSLLKGNEQ